MSRYSAPQGIDEALQALASGARAVAGGTDLVVGVRQGRFELPGDLVALHRLGAIAGIGTDDDGALHVGAGTTHAAITHMESAKMPETIVEALKAAHRRARELGQ